LYADCFCDPQVLTDIVPYGDLREVDLPFSIMVGERPHRPMNTTNVWLSDPVWMMLEDCWSESRGVRWDARCMRRRFCDPQDIRTEGIPCIGEGECQVAFWLITPVIAILWYLVASHAGCSARPTSSKSLSEVSRQVSPVRARAARFLRPAYFEIGNSGGKGSSPIGRLRQGTPEKYGSSQHADAMLCNIGLEILSL